jgi:hypothetical protein
VAHLDHALRRGSGGDRRFVARLAATLDLPFVDSRRDVKASARGTNRSRRPRAACAARS